MTDVKMGATLTRRNLVFRRDVSRRSQIDRREIMLWTLVVAATSFLVQNYLLQEGAARFPIFDGLGFYVAGMRLARSHARPATPPEIFAALAAAVLAALGPRHAPAAALTLLALLVVASRDGDARAAGAVMLALAGHQLWGKVLFAAIAPELVTADATLVGLATQLFVPGAEWSGAVISTSPEFSIVVQEGCSSFRNVSTALLCYISVSKLERPNWRRGDLWVAAATCATQVFLNVARIYAMAQSYSMFEYWHNGRGADVYAAVASASAVLISAVGARLADRP